MNRGPSRCPQGRCDVDEINAVNLESMAADLLATVAACCGAGSPCSACREAHRRAAQYQARAHHLRTPHLGLAQLVRMGDA